MSNCFIQPYIINMSFYTVLDIVNMFNLVIFEQVMMNSVDIIGN